MGRKRLRFVVRPYAVTLTTALMILDGLVSIIPHPARSQGIRETAARQESSPTSGVVSSA